MPKPRDKGRPKTCHIHDTLMEPFDGLIVRCPVDECEVSSVRNKWKKKLALGWVTCYKCNWCYPSPIPEKCAVCEGEAKEKLAELISE